MPRTTSKISIPHTSDPGINIIGLLEQLEPEKPTNGRPLALICHGAMGHKDYLFQKRLAQQLPLDSFRFDFCGNAETGDPWRLGDLQGDVEDIRVVADYLISHYGYTITYAVGHSRGALTGFRWVAEQGPPGARDIKGWVNVSGRFRMEKLFARTKVYDKAFKEKGYFDWHVKVAGKPVVGKIYPGNVEEFASWDVTYLQTFPKHVHVLTIHGLQDKVVPPYDALLYARTLNSRTPATHNLHLEEADHNFVGFQSEVVNPILEWISALESNSLSTGIWRTGVPHVEVVKEARPAQARKQELEEGVLPLDGADLTEISESSVPAVKAKL